MTTDIQLPHPGLNLNQILKSTLQINTLMLRSFGTQWAKYLQLINALWDGGASSWSNCAWINICLEILG